MFLKSQNCHDWSELKGKSLKQYAQKTKNLETKTKMMWQSVTEHNKKRLKYEQ